jgi:protein-L-isoaspartate O-methyltransferase
MEAFLDKRRRMVGDQIAARGIFDQAVLQAMRAVPCELFVPDAAVEFAYEDTPLAIEEGQTISQSYVVALMVAALELTPRDRVLASCSLPQRTLAISLPSTRSAA